MIKSLGKNNPKNRIGRRWLLLKTKVGEDNLMPYPDFVEWYSQELRDALCYYCGREWQDPTPPIIFLPGTTNPYPWQPVTITYGETS